MLNLKINMRPDEERKMIEIAVNSLESDLEIVSREGDILQANSFLIRKSSPFLQSLIPTETSTPTRIHLPDASSLGIWHLINIVKQGFSTGLGSENAVAVEIEEAARLLEFTDVLMLSFDGSREIEMRSDMQEGVSESGDVSEENETDEIKNEEFISRAQKRPYMRSPSPIQINMDLFHEVSSVGDCEIDNRKIRHKVAKSTENVDTSSTFSKERVINNVFNEEPNKSNVNYRKELSQENVQRNKEDMIHTGPNSRIIDLSKKIISLSRSTKENTIINMINDESNDNDFNVSGEGICEGKTYGKVKCKSIGCSHYTDGEGCPHVKDDLCTENIIQDENKNIVDICKNEEPEEREQEEWDREMDHNDQFIDQDNIYPVSTTQNDHGQNAMKECYVKLDKNCPAMFSVLSIEPEKTEVEVYEKIFNNCEVREAISDKLNVKDEDKSGENGDVTFIPCGTCNMRYSNASTLLVHSEQHKGDVRALWGCSFCAFTARRTSMLMHLRAIHTGEKLFECGLCRKRFASCSYLRVHEKTAHC